MFRQIKTTLAVLFIFIGVGKQFGGIAILDTVHDTFTGKLRALDTVSGAAVASLDINSEPDGI